MWREEREWVSDREVANLSPSTPQGVRERARDIYVVEAAFLKHFSRKGLQNMWERCSDRRKKSGKKKNPGCYLTGEERKKTSCLQGRLQKLGDCPLFTCSLVKCSLFCLVSFKISKTILPKDLQLNLLQSMVTVWCTDLINRDSDMRCMWKTCSQVRTQSCTVNLTAVVHRIPGTLAVFLSLVTGIPSMNGKN